MRIYLDNNILIYIENGKYDLSQFLSVSDAEYYYSEIHMDELMNGLDTHPELKDIRLKTIGELCGSKYIVPDVAGYKMEIEERLPQSAFNLSMRFKFIHDQIYLFSKSMKIERDVFLKELKMNRLDVNNYKPTEILPLLDIKMNENWGYGIKEHLEKSVANTGRTVFLTLFNLLDFVCYWHDEDHAARLYDSSHAYFAQMCDVLVSNDRRMRIKSEAVYSYLGIETKVVTADEFLDIK